MAPTIGIGDEVKLRNIKDKPVGVVTRNESDMFCIITKEGITYNMSRPAANPIKIGRHFESTVDFLRSIS